MVDGAGVVGRLGLLAHLFGDLGGGLDGDILAVLLRHVVAALLRDLVALFPRNLAAVLLGVLLAHLLGNLEVDVVADLLGDVMTLLLGLWHGDSVAALLLHPLTVLVVSVTRAHLLFLHVTFLLGEELLETGDQLVLQVNPALGLPDLGTFLLGLGLMFSVTNFLMSCAERGKWLNLDTKIQRYKDKRAGNIFSIL